MSNGLSCNRLGVIGTGRVARAMLLALASFSRTTPMLFGRSFENARNAALEGHADMAADLGELLHQCDVIAIAVSDDAVADIATDLAGHYRPGQQPFIFHVSGRSGAAVLRPLENLGALTAAIHPVMAFTGDPQVEAERMKGSPFGVTGSGPAASAFAARLVEALGGAPFMIEEILRPLYHGALSHAANHLVTLLAGAADTLRAAGIDTPYQVLAPLARASLENSLELGFSALSGPLLRGDEATVRNHLTAFGDHHPAILPAYRAMALATVDRLEDESGARPHPCRRDLEGQ
ncbi:Rossmann-like and DUF2520 domain-containing protein [Sphingomonas colocasiae]|uniref:DUF2520 domain-containing protein n=1 Tax=Sphingomonas colocasiae TaxID=1848973 RepID=A0ABS7PQ21_9SPHN|nr:DUF2520 domain-containing protein [Sphingomonas colocasiae]MBY8823084.1 DUF2520 domain-containing protein [Sphingomonas colocasiae]